MKYRMLKPVKITIESEEATIEVETSWLELNIDKKIRDAQFFGDFLRPVFSVDTYVNIEMGANPVITAKRNTGETNG